MCETFHTLGSGKGTLKMMHFHLEGFRRTQEEIVDFILCFI